MVVADPDERRYEPVGEGRGPAPSATLAQADFDLASGLGSTARSGQTCAGEVIGDATEEEVVRGFEAIKTVVINAPRAKV